uniref:C2H2-type domain-containing protein n=1 Tax=Schistosoma mansoni TaxID=6183 RepID=A0A5K4EVX0_SCHMA
MTSNLGFFNLMNNFLPSDKCLLVNDLGCTSYSTSSVSCPNLSCLCVTEDLQLMEQHYATCHHHSCSLCGISFISSRLLSVHEQITHCGAFKPKLDCFLAVCPQKFYDSAELFSHAYNCHGLLPDSSVLIGTMISVENRDSNKIGCSCIKYKFTPGTNFPEHTHDEDKLDCIVSGQLSFSMYGKEIILGPGDRLEVPRNIPHSARVVGKNPLVFVDATRRR